MLKSIFPVVPHKHTLSVWLIYKFQLIDDLCLCILCHMYLQKLLQAGSIVNNVLNSDVWVITFNSKFTREDNVSISVSFFP